MEVYLQEQYIEEAHRTLSPNFFVSDDESTAISWDQLAIGIEEAGWMIKAIDADKKAMYYNKKRSSVQRPSDNEASADSSPLRRFCAESRKYQRQILQNIDPVKLHGVYGVITEAGELLDLLLQEAMGTPIPATKYADEMGDVEWYMATLYRRLGLKPDAVRYANIQKLKTRFPDRFTEHHAIDRDTDAEVDAVVRAMD